MFCHSLKEMYARMKACRTANAEKRLTVRNRIYVVLLFLTAIFSGSITSSLNDTFTEFMLDNAVEDGDSSLMLPAVTVAVQEPVPSDILKHGKNAFGDYMRWSHFDFEGNPVPREEVFMCSPANFGPLAIDDVSGPLAIADTLACSESDFVADQFKDAIAVVQRGGCNFMTKVANLQNAGAKAVIVGDNDDKRGVPTFMVGVENFDQTIRIPSAMISRAGYQYLLARESFEVVVADLPGGTPDYDTIETVSCMMTATVFMFLTVFLTVGAFATKRKVKMLQLARQQEAEEVLEAPVELPSYQEKAGDVEQLDEKV